MIGGFLSRPSPPNTLETRFLCGFYFFAHELPTNNHILSIRSSASSSVEGYRWAYVLRVVLTFE